MSVEKEIGCLLEESQRVLQKGESSKVEEMGVRMAEVEVRRVGVRRLGVTMRYKILTSMPIKAVFLYLFGGKWLTSRANSLALYQI